MTGRYPGLTAWGLVTALCWGCGPAGKAPDPERFDRLAAVTVERTDRVHAQLVDPAGPPPSPAGPFDAQILHFVDLVQDARCEPPRAGARALEPVRTWSFVASPQPLATVDDEVRLELEGVPAAAVGAIRVWAEVADGLTQARLVIGRGDRHDEVSIPLGLPAATEPRETTVDLRDIVDRLDSPVLSRLGLEWVAGPPARVVAAELLPRTWLFPEWCGAGSHRVAGETRPAISLVGGSQAGWQLNGVWKDATLEFATAQVVPDRRTRLEVLLEHSGGLEVLAELTVAGGAGWQEHRITLGDRDLDGARLSVAATATARRGDDRPGVVLWGSPVLWSPRERRLHVLLLLEDALRADRMSVYGHDRPTTPFKRELFAGGARFRWSIAQSTKTRYSCPSLMTSLRPLATGVYGAHNPNPRLAGHYLTLAEVLSRRGWATAAFLQNANAGPDNGLDQGFDRVVENIPGRADAVYSEEVADWMHRHRGRNLFVSLHVADPHQPYEPPPEHDRWFRQLVARAGGPQWHDPGWVAEARRARYDGEVAANDAALRPFLARLEQLGLLRDTVVVLISDHGEHLGEHDLWDHIPPSYIQVIRVPLLIHAPGRVAAGREIVGPVRNLDVMPTLLELAGLDAESFALHGRSLVPALGATTTGDALPARLAVVQEAMSYRSSADVRPLGSVLWDRWHVLVSTTAGPVLFDLEADPREEHPLPVPAALEARVRRLLSDLAARDHRLHEELVGAGRTDSVVDAEALRNLEALGYLGG